MPHGIEESLTLLRETIEESFTLPFGRDKTFVDKDKCLGLIDEILSTLPGEIKQARHITANREDMIEASKRESEAIIRSAREQAKRMISEQEILREAKRQAAEVRAQAEAKKRELQRSTNEYVETRLIAAEKSVSTSLNELRQARNDLRNTARK
ncbi:MAG: hypothetical protein FWH04_02875 [Oscillospiraceae bacterium]|nr:hypothetical protein [Oscillospiraceae bacterium]